MAIVSKCSLGAEPQAWRIPVSINVGENQVGLGGCRFDTLFEVVQMKSDFETATLQPMRHDPGACTKQVVHENDPRSAHGNCAIGNTKKLPAFRRNRTLQMGRRELFRRSNVEKISRSGRVTPPRFGCCPIDKQQFVIVGECFQARPCGIFRVVTGKRIDP